MTAKYAWSGRDNFWTLQKRELHDHPNGRSITSVYTMAYVERKQKDCVRLWHVTMYQVPGGKESFASLREAKNWAMAVVKLEDSP